MTFYQQIDANKRKSFLIMIAFVAFITLAVYAMAYGFGFSYDYVWLAVAISGFSSVFSYYFSDKMVLGLSGARPADRKQDFLFYTVTENLCIGAGIPMPKLYVIDDPAMNAFATGRDPNHASVCATRGLLEVMNRSELEGVIAHELSHVRNYDTRLMSIVTILVGVVALIADWFLRLSFWGGGRNNRRNNNRDEGGGQAIFMLVGIAFAILSPIVATLIQLAISREREYLADASGAGLTKYPAGLASALAKLEREGTPLHTASNATAHLFIHSPFHTDNPGMNLKPKAFFSGLFSTHPPLADRIKRLQEM